MLLLDCQKSLAAEGSLFAISIFTTSLLLLFRTRAVFLGNRRATVLFFLFWSAVVCSCLSVTYIVKASSYLPRLGCGFQEMGESCITCFIVAALEDVFLFASLSWKILSFFAEGEDKASYFRYFLGKDALPTVAHALLSSAQQYFL